MNETYSKEYVVTRTQITVALSSLFLSQAVGFGVAFDKENHVNWDVFFALLWGIICQVMTFWGCMVYLKIHTKNLLRQRTLENQNITTQEIVVPKIESDTWDGGFDTNDARYPEELDIALQAWRAVCNKPTNTPIREQLTNWVRQSYPSLSAAATDRIVGVCNWDKSGGRPKTIE